MHLHAGVSNGGMVEYHYVAVQLLKQIYDHLPEPSNGWLTLPDKPGLGFAPNSERVRELAKLPLSSGKGKA
jgi:L-rhamnonate dehydratase